MFFGNRCYAKHADGRGLCCNFLLRETLRSGAKDMQVQMHAQTHVRKPHMLYIISLQLRNDAISNMDISSIRSNRLLEKHSYAKSGHSRRAVRPSYCAASSGTSG